MAQLKMLRVVTAADAFEARVIAARLGAEGIVWELRGSVDGPFALGTVDILVAETDYDTAREVLLPQEEPTELRHDDGGGEVATALARGRRDLWLIAAVVVALALFAVARMGARV